MCFSTSTIWFGITVKALDLCIAAMTFVEIKPTLLAIDLILARKAAGTLATTVVPGKVSVGALPVEVWDIAKLKLSALSYVEEYAGLEGRFHPGWSIDSYWEEDEQERAERPLTFDNLLLNEMGFNNFFEKTNVCSFTDERKKDVASLLEHFGLCLASPTLISNTGEDTPWADFNGAWPVAIPLVGEKSQSYPTVEAGIAHDDVSAHRVARIAPSALELPMGAAGRFRRLLAAYPAVSPVWISSDTFRSPADTTPAAVADDQDVNSSPEKGFRSIFGP
ncbi:hypothetical protein JCM3775_004724 [Rhodotorula graminis]